MGQKHWSARARSTTKHDGTVTTPLAKAVKQADGGGFQIGARAPFKSDSRAANGTKGESHMVDNKAGESKGTRVIALVGPAGAGKTSLAEAMLFAAGAT